MLLAHLLVLSISAKATLAAYRWPSKRYDQLEALMYSLSDYNRMGFADGVMPCSFSSSFQAGRASSAEWIRTAYHDMATHDAAAGTGGLDASIMFETERGESGAFPDAFNSTLGFFWGYHNERVSVADLIALGTYMAVRSCGGPALDVRVGRVDAVKAGGEGVPQPDETIVALKDKFAKAGFGETDMIKMTACGHTLGGVHDQNPNGTFVTSSRHAFDSTSGQFDHAVVAEYLNGTTANFLVTGPASNNSDLRVFSADNNRTMQSISTASTFRVACKDILTRMIDTVPRGTVLSEVIQPIAVKPVNVRLELDAQGRVVFAGDIRVLMTGRASPEFNVSVVYADRAGKFGKQNVIATTVPQWRGGMGYAFDYSFKYFTFSAILPPSGISSFNVTITSAAKTELHTNSGHGFPIDDTVIYQRPQSCLVQTADAQGKWNLTVVAAVHKSQGNKPVSFEFIERTPRPRVLIPQLIKKVIPMKAWAAGGSQYTLYTGSHKIVPEMWSSTFDVVSGAGPDKKVDDFNFSGGLPVVCAPFV